MTDLIITPVGRFIAGNLFEAKLNDQNGREEFFMALAIRKDDKGLPAFKAALLATAKKDWPGEEYKKKDFAWKKVDGDHEDYADRPQYHGCEVFRLTSGILYAPRVMPLGKKDLMPAGSVNPGDYVRVLISVKGNGSKKSPGMYMNFSQVEFVGYGEKIKRNEKDHFADVAVEIPSYVSKTPVISADEKDHSFLNPTADDDISF